MAWKNLILLDKIWMVEPNAWLKKMKKNTGHELAFKIQL